MRILFYLHVFFNVPPFFMWMQHSYSSFQKISFKISCKLKLLTNFLHLYFNESLFVLTFLLSNLHREQLLQGPIVPYFFLLDVLFCSFIGPFCLDAKEHSIVMSHVETGIRLEVLLIDEDSCFLLLIHIPDRHYWPCQLGGLFQLFSRTVSLLAGGGLPGKRMSLEQYCFSCCMLACSNRVDLFHFLGSTEMQMIWVTFCGCLPPSASPGGSPCKLGLWCDTAPPHYGPDVSRCRVRCGALLLAGPCACGSSPPAD